MPRARSRQRVAQRFCLFRQAIAFLAQSANLRLQLRGILLQRGKLRRHGFQLMRRAFRVIARAHRSFQHLVLVRFQFPLRLGLVYQRFFRLLLLAVQPQQAFARDRRALPQRLDTPFGVANLHRALLRAL